MQSQRPEFDKLGDNGQDLVQKCGTDTEPVEETLAELKRDWDDIEARLGKALDQVDSMKAALSQLDEDLKPVDEVCTKVERGLEEIPAFGVDVDAGEKELGRLQV